MAVQFTSAKEYIQAVFSDDQEFVRRVERHINEHRLGKMLMMLRCRMDFTQQGLANRMNVSIGEILVLEDKSDREMTIGELADYSTAMGFDFDRGFYQKN